MCNRQKCEHFLTSSLIGTTDEEWEQCLHVMEDAK